MSGWTIFLFVVLAVIGATLMANLHDIKRYLKIRKM